MATKKTTTTTVTTTIEDEPAGTPLLALVLDRSGSMQGQWHQVVPAVEKFLDEQKAQPDLRFICTVFDDYHETIADAPLKAVSSRLIAKYPPRGSTALLDAVGRTIRHVETADPTGKVLLVVYTDGYENASKDWTKARLSALLTEKRAQGWGVLFLGAEEAAWASEGIGAGAGISHGAGQVGQTFAAASGSSTAYYAGVMPVQDLAADVVSRSAGSTTLTSTHSPQEPIPTV